MTPIGPLHDHAPVPALPPPGSVCYYLGLTPPCAPARVRVLAVAPETVPFNVRVERVEDGKTAWVDAGTLWRLVEGGKARAGTGAEEAQLGMRRVK